MNHRLRGYSNPDDVMDYHSHHFHHIGGANALNTVPSAGVDAAAKDSEADSCLSRLWIGVCSICSLRSQESPEESAEDEQTR
jgi:hypothetical protein